MKKTTLLLACLLGLLVCSSAVAGQGAKRARGKKAEQAVPIQQVLKRFDKDANGKIDGAEADALRKAFDGPKHAALKALDKNGNGKLDDAEIAAIQAAKQGKKQKRKEK
ncbi:MAG: hypothetical protein HY735_22245 [Verrucomicrobia bacterium]|nr:hypothetical protein [Verrucomicrobiota bacterium]